MNSHHWSIKCGLVGLGTSLLTPGCGGEAPRSEASSIASTSQALSGDGTPLAVEYGSAQAWGNVAYGANGSFFFRTIHGAFDCNDATFGDPLVGMWKACYNAGTLPAPPMATHSRGDSPTGAFAWSDDVQGLAHDASHWFITDAGSLWKVPLTSSLNTDYPQGYDRIILPGGRGNGSLLFGQRPLPVPLRGNPNWVYDLNGYDHFGDLDAHSFGGANVLFIPMQGSGPPTIAIFDADTLDYVTSTVLSDPTESAFLGIDLAASAGFVAVQSGASANDLVRLWVSGAPTTLTGVTGTPIAFVSYTFDANHEIIDPNGNWVNAPGTAIQMAPKLTAATKMIALDRNGHPVTDMYTMQGAVFNEDGTLLYTANGYCDSLARQHVFRIGGGRATLWDESFNPGDLGTQPSADRSFVFESQLPYPWTGCSGDEAEGLDYFDTRGQNVADIPNSQLHALLGSYELGDDDVWLKNYSIPDATPQPIPNLNLALNQWAWGSSQFPGAYNPKGYPTSAYLAIDGNTDGNYWNGSVTHTDYGYVAGAPADIPAQWWYVWLGAVRTVNAVNIYNRTDCCSERLSGYKVLAFDPNNGWYVISDHTGDDTTGVTEIEIPLPQVQTGYILIAKTDPNYLHLAEVQVMGH